MSTDGSMAEMLRGVVRGILRAGHRATAILDKPYMREEIPCEWPPVFIVGPPRSGTTLLAQLMVRRFHFAYVTNIANTFYMAPLFATRLGRRFCREYRTDFSSDYGLESGCLAPSEAGNVWNRWFPYEKREGFNYTPKDYLDSSARNEIYRLVAQFERLARLPFITKNVKWSVRLQALHQIFPEARFLRIRRPAADAALSILRRKREAGMGTTWWSVMPKEIEEIRDLPDLDQAILQVHYVEKTLDEDGRLFGPERMLTVEYAELCRNPKSELDRIQGFLSGPIDVTVNETATVPRAFEPRQPDLGGLISREEVAAVRDRLSSFSKQSERSTAR